MILNVVTKSGVRIMVPFKLKRYLFYIKPTVRLCLILIFLLSTFSISISWTSVISLVLLLVSYIFFKSKPQDDESQDESSVVVQSEEFTNPYKGKTGSGHLTKDKEIEIALAVESFVVDDASKAKCLERFEVLKKSSECIFARKAKLWGCPDYDYSASLEENMKRTYPTLLKFTLALLDLGLSGFLVELPGDLFGQDIETFASAVRRTLVSFKEEDKRRHHKQRLKKKDKLRKPRPVEDDWSIAPPTPEKTKLWGKRNWVFEINTVTFFITTFAPFYPETNSRYNFGCKDCYILMQPEISFAVHDLPPDTPDTNWVCPVTVRDKIRVAFHKSGRTYEAPLKLSEPMVFEIVKRIYPEDDPVRWWDVEDDSEENKMKSTQMALSQS